MRWSQGSFQIDRQYNSFKGFTMAACLYANGLTRLFLNLLSGLLLTFVLAVFQAQASPEVVSVNHRVSVDYSKTQFDAKKGIYTTQVRITNRSGVALLSPLRLSFGQAGHTKHRIVNAHGVGDDGRPYFEFKLPKGMLQAKTSTDISKMVIAVEQGKDSIRGNANAISAALRSGLHVSAGVESALLNPQAYPDALPAKGGKMTVLVSVPLVGKAKSEATVYLRRRGDKQIIAMNDVGKEGDFIAKDGIHGVNVQIDTDKAKSDSCLYYETFIKLGRTELVSPLLQLCVSNFPVGIAESNTDEAVTFPDGTKAVANEILISVTPETTASAIRELAGSIHASIAGTILPMNFYQLRLPSPVSASRLQEIVAQLEKQASVTNASINAIGQGALAVNDHAFNLDPTNADSQHGLKLVIGHVQSTNANAWDAGGNGSGVTVVVLDTGLEDTHEDLDTAWTCQDVPATLPALPNPVPVVLSATCTDTQVGATPAGHGTKVTGVIAARSNNIGVAGVAYGSNIHSIKMLAFNTAGMIAGFRTAAGYAGFNGNAKIFNASFNLLSGATMDELCTAIESVVWNGSARAIVVNAAGNQGLNGFSYPARCIDSNANLVHKNLFITVSNSASFAHPSCGSVGVNERCGAAVPVDANQNGSNFGSWVDIAAPGSAIRTTAIGNTYSSSATPATGTSFSAPFVSGAAAILASCGVLPSQIKSALVGSANVPIQYPAYGVFPSGTTPRLDIKLATASCNQPPETNAGSGSGFEDAASIAVTLSGSDVGGSVASFQITNLPANGLLYNNAGLATVLNMNDTVSATANAATVYFVPTQNFNGSTSFNYASIDNLGMADATPAIASITVTAVNDAPSFTKGADQTVLEDAGAQSVPGWATNLSKGPADEAGQTLSFSITGNSNPALFSALPAISSAGGLTYIPATNANGSATITVALTDTGGTANGGADTSASQTFDITVTSVNDAPSFVKGADQSVLEDSGAQSVPGWATSLSAGPANEAAQALSFSITGNTNTALFSVAPMIGSTGTLTYTPAPGVTGSATITVVLTDTGTTANGGADTSAPQTFVITLTHKLTGSPSISPTIPPQRQSGDSVTAMTAGMSDGDCPSIDNISGISGGLCSTTCELAYQWRASVTLPPVPGDAITGATNSTYTLQDSEKNKFMSLCVSTGTGLNCDIKCSTTDTMAVGDPHITTVDGLRYDFQGAGEFVALRGANGMEIQLRMAPVSSAPPLPDDYTGLTSGASVNTAVAGRVGKHRVSYQPDTSPNAAANTFVLRVDGVPTTLPAGGIDLGDGGRVLPQSGGIQIDFPDQTTLMINNNWGTFYGAAWLHVSVFHTSAFDGIMGARSKGSWLPRLSDGSAFGAKPASLHDRYVELYVKFADSWRVTDKTSLFDYADGTSTATFTNKAWPTENGPYTVGNEPVAKPLGLKAAQLACRDVVGKHENANCIFDVRVLGHAELAKGHLLNQKIRLGAVNVVVRGADKLNVQGELVVTATVARHAAVVPNVKGARAVPAGTVQFMLGDKPLGKPVKLDEKGQAKLAVSRLNLERFNVGKQAITARYLPVRDKANVFLPSISRKLTRELVGLK